MGLRATDSKLDQAMRRVEGESTDANAFARATWQCLSTQFARNGARMMAAHPELVCGVVTSRINVHSFFGRNEFPAFASMPHRIVYTPQARLPDGTHAPLPGGLTESDLQILGRGTADALAAAGPPEGMPGPKALTGLTSLRPQIHRYDGNARGLSVVPSRPSRYDGTSRGHGVVRDV